MGELISWLRWVVPIVLLVVYKIGICSVDKTITWYQGVSVACRIAFFVQHHQTTAVSTAEDAVNVHPIMASVDFYSVGRGPLKLHGGIKSTQSVKVIVTTNVFNHAFAVSKAEVQAARQCVGQRAGDHAVIFLGAKVAHNAHYRSFELIGWLLVENIDGAADCVTAV